MQLSQGQDRQSLSPEGVRPPGAYATLLTRLADL
jgi:hypothetical protein